MLAILFCIAGVKASKVLINSAGDIKLTDFGIRGKLINSNDNSDEDVYITPVC